jgi:hypothetical protein
MWLLDRARREGSLPQSRFHAKAQSKAAKAQEGLLFLFAPLLRSFVALREKIFRYSPRTMYFFPGA